MIEYANESAVKLLKQYEMLSKSLKFTRDYSQRDAISCQMTKILQSYLEITNINYENKYKKVVNKTVYLMDEEKSRLLELVNLINERRTYINNQIATNKELTGINLEIADLMGEDKLEEYKNQVKIIDRYKNNIKLESVLKEEIQVLENNIKRANDKINNNKNLNKQLEDRMIRILDKAFDKLSINELLEREKEIDLAYTELGYSIEVAKENAKVARKNCAEDIILECDNMLSSITLEYERYKEKKLILKLFSIYKNKVETYDELLIKREDINTILSSVTGSELYSLVGNELNKEYATIKLEGQDVATLNSLVEEKELKLQTLKDIDEENNSDIVRGILSSLLENEKKYQEKLMLEKKKKEAERKEKERLEEIRKKEEMARRQKVLEEERKKEIEERTKQLLVEKKKSILISPSENKVVSRVSKLNNSSKPIMGKTVTRREEVRPNLIPKKSSNAPKLNKKSFDFEFDEGKIEKKDLEKNVSTGIPVIKNIGDNNEFIKKNEVKANDESSIFPKIDLEKKDSIFPEFTDIQRNNSFFDESEFNDLKDYIDDNKKGWF